MGKPTYRYERDRRDNANLAKKGAKLAAKAAKAKSSATTGQDVALGEKSEAPH